MRCFHNGNIVQFLFILGAALLLTLILPVKFILFILTVLLIYLGFIILTRLGGRVKMKIVVLKVPKFIGKILKSVFKMND